ncbi:MAG TPA: outer membrane beta-barrel protein [Kiritimatiellia bacterium]|nr:outer membrane beta-barrel protein [Kiritimatiellia bacterium]
MKKIILGAVSLAVTMTVALAFNEGINLGVVRLNLWGELSGTYDSNARIVVPEGEIQNRQIFQDEAVGGLSDKEDDIFFELSLGGRLFRETDRFYAALIAMIQARRYVDFDELDNESFIQELELRLGERRFDKFTVSLRQTYREVFDYESMAYPDDLTNPDTDALFLSEDRTERVSRQLLDLAGILTWRITEKLNADFSVAYGTIEYDTDELFDWEDLKGQAELDYRVTDRTALLLTGQYGIQNSDGLENEPDYYVLRGGFLNRTTDKLTFKGGVGAGRYDRFREKPDADDVDPADEVRSTSDDTIDYLSFDVAGDYDLSQRTKLQFIGRNAIQPAAQYEDNPKLVTVASVGISHRLFDRFRLAGTVSYRNDDYEDPVEVDTGVFIDQKDTIWGGQIRLDYLPPNARLNAYVEARYENRETTLPDEDYDQLRLTIGVRIEI